MSKPEIFVGRLREGVFNIIASADTTSADPKAVCLEVLLVESDALYRGKFSDAQLAKLCLGPSTARSISLWFSDLEVFRRDEDGSIVVFLMEKRVIRIMLTIKKINLDAAACVPKCPRCTPARISEWSEEGAADRADATAVAEIPELAEFTTEFAELKRRYPYINVELPAESPALKRLRACYSSAGDSEHETSSSDYE